MKLAILGPYPVDSSNNSINGGVQAVIVNMVKGISRFKDLDIHIITANPGISDNLDFISDGIHVHAVHLDKRFGNITLYSNTRKRLRDKIRILKPDLVHTHMFGYYTLAALDSGHKKVIVSTHGISNSNWGISYNIIEKIRRYLQDYIYIKCVNGSRDIIINSPFARTCLAGFKKMKIYELNNPVSDVFFDIDNRSAEEQRILFAGHVCESKGITTLLHAMNILKKSFGQVRLMIAGDIADQDYYSRIKRFIEERGLAGSVNFLGHLNDAELLEEYRKASIFAFPSQQDVAPLALLQAMAAGKAIVTTLVGGIPYIIDDGVNGFLIQKKAFSALADKISLLIKDRRLLRRMGDNAREKVSSNYRISTVSEGLYKIYGEFYNNG